MASKKPVFYLIDGHAVAYRQYFGIPAERFSTSSGEPTNATYGFTRILLDIIQKDKPEYLAVAFDAGLSGRDTVYGEYKGTRDKMPDDLVPQITRIMQVVETLNIPVLMVDGYEADDVIGTVTQQAPDVHFRITTGDRDLLQLLNDNVTVALPSRNGPDEEYDIPKFTEKYNIRPDQLVDQKALMGDSSDNIPGIKGIGEKTAAKLLNQYDTLDGIYANVEAIKGANRKKLDGGRDLAYISQELAQIQKDVPVQLVLEDCQTHDFDVDKAVELFRELEFRNFTDRLLNPPQDQPPAPMPSAASDGSPAQLSLFGDTAPPPAKAVEHVVKTVIVNDDPLLADLVEALNNAQSIVWDVETTSIDQMQAELVGIALAVDIEQGYYVPVGHDNGQQLPMEQVLDALRPALTNPDIPKYAHNAAYDLVVMARYGVDVAPVGFDSMIAEWLLNPTSKFLGLKNFAAQFLGVNMTPITDLLGTGKKQKTMAQIDIEQAAPYAAADAALTMQAVELLRPKLEEENALSLYHALELPLIPVIVTMERAGIHLNTEYLHEMSQRLDEKLSTLAQNIYDLSGGYGEFNINSPKQLNDVLFGKLNLPVEGLKKTTHGYSTNAATLDALMDEHEIIGLIVEYRELSKLKGTYVDALPELVNPQTGRLHTSYNQTGTSTGRLSSNNPNLQNIPIRTEIGREVRRAFVAPPGRVLLAVDYSQIELRVLAHISKDETLLEAFAQDQDIHRATAAAVYGIPLEDVTYEQRSFAKRVNFGLIYGMSAYRLARDSDLTQSEARAFVETYFNRLPRVQTYIQTTEAKAFEQGYVETLLGRRRHFAALQGRQSQRGQARIQAELRAAINMPIQGTAADIMKQAMIDLHSALTEQYPDVLMTLQVHDEIVLEVAEDQLDAVKTLVVDVMENAYTMDVPLRANAQSGTNWRDMTDI